MSPEDTVQAAAQSMRDCRLGFLPVIDAYGRAVGALTDRDIAVRAVAADVAVSTARVRDFMTAEVVACQPDDDIGHAEQLMRLHQKSRVLVVDRDERLCGVISLSDIAKTAGVEESGRTLRGVASREQHPS